MFSTQKPSKLKEHKIQPNAWKDPWKLDKEPHLPKSTSIFERFLAHTHTNNEDEGRDKKTRGVKRNGSEGQGGRQNKVEIGNSTKLLKERLREECEGPIRVLYFKVCRRHNAHSSPCEVVSIGHDLHHCTELQHQNDFFTLQICPDSHTLMNHDVQDSKRDWQ